MCGNSQPSDGVLSKPVHGPTLLEALADLPVSTWSYIADPDVRHLGPMAQDFYAAFGLSGSDTEINLIDANGVLIVAVQALYRRVVELEGEVARLSSAPAHAKLFSSTAR